MRIWFNVTAIVEILLLNFLDHAFIKFLKTKISSVIMCASDVYFSVLPEVQTLGTNFKLSVTVQSKCACDQSLT